MHYQPPTNLNATFSDLLCWLKRPDESAIIFGKGERWRLFWRLLLIDFIFSVPIWWLLEGIETFFLPLEFTETEYLESLPETLFIYCIYAPLIEELIFRLPLKYRYNYILRPLNALSSGWIGLRWHRVYRFFVYFSIICFGLIHLTNYENQTTLFYAFAPIIAGSQLIGGATLSYSRVKLGMTWAILHHAMFNLVAVIVEETFS